MMSFFLHDGFDGDGFEQVQTPLRSNRLGAQRDDLRIFQEKLKIPQTGRLIARPRLDELLKKSLSQYCATLVSGRAGTGKTALAAGFASKHGPCGWYTIESSDSGWNTFSAYFATCVEAAAGASKRKTEQCEATGGSPPYKRNARGCSEGLLPVVAGGSDAAIAQFLVNTFGPVSAKSRKEFLIVLDDLHKIFDAEWFGPFFHLLLYSLPENCRLLLLCRSKPPAPLWRLRSKQMLNVVDEKLLTFDREETARLFSGTGLSSEEISKAQTESFGRPSKLVQILS